MFCLLIDVEIGLIMDDEYVDVEVFVELKFVIDVWLYWVL